MRISVTVAALTVFLGAVSLIPRISAEPDFSQPKPYLGFSNPQGQIVLWTELEPIVLSDGTLLPLRLRFSGEETTGVSLFGQFWWCPVAECTLVARDEKFFTMTTFGGRTVFLKKDKDGGMASRDGRYIGRVVSPSETHVEGEGWTYRFVRGRLMGAKKAGVDLEWKYDGSKLVSISERTGTAVLTLEYIVNEPLPVAIATGKTRYALKSQQVPVVSPVPGSPLVAGFAPTLLDLSGAFHSEVFPITLETDGTYVMSHERNEGSARRFVWDAASGLLISDGKWTYQVAAKEGHAPIVSRTNAAGQLESYFYDTRKGISEHLQPDGTVVKRIYFINAGPAWHKIRKLTISKDDKELESRQWSYDESGRLIRETIGQLERYWTFHENGKLESEGEIVSGRVKFSNLYDSEGRVQEKEIFGQKLVYLYEPENTVVQLMDGDRVVSKKVTNRQGTQSDFFIPDSKGEALRLVKSGIPVLDPSGKIKDLATPLKKEISEIHPKIFHE